MRRGGGGQLQAQAHRGVDSLAFQRIASEAFGTVGMCVFLHVCMCLYVFMCVSVWLHMCVGLGQRQRGTWTGRTRPETTVSPSLCPLGKGTGPEPPGSGVTGLRRDTGGLSEGSCVGLRGV